ncbi:MAG: hypothetical protein R2715_02705 [Ilumatobacteraceae bacterium]
MTITVGAVVFNFVANVPSCWARISVLHIIGGGEIAVAGPTATVANATAKCLAAARLTEEQDRTVLLDEPEGGEVLDELAINRGLELEVEVLEPSPIREPGIAQPRARRRFRSAVACSATSRARNSTCDHSFVLASSASVANEAAAASRWR